MISKHEEIIRYGEKESQILRLKRQKHTDRETDIGRDRDMERQRLRNKGIKRNRERFMKVKDTNI